jgi:ADP-ribose pyrophosphatase
MVLSLCPLLYIWLTRTISDPGFCTTGLKMCHVVVDMSKPENQNPIPQLEASEFIETFTLPLKSLWASCKKFEKEGYVIDATVGTLAEGIEIALRCGLQATL